MSDRLRSVGLDVGTTTTQLIVSELEVRNLAGAFAVPEMAITDRKILYQSPVRFTPLLDESHVDGKALREIVAAEYRAAGIRRETVDTGAVIVTGETSRKENARAVLENLSELAGDFVVATAGPELESILAAKGAGAVAYSQETGKTVLHMDIGGGTSNLALIRAGEILATGCLNVGGRLLKFDPSGRITYVSPVLEGLCSLKVGDRPGPGETAALARTLTRALEAAAGLREDRALLEKLWTREAGAVGLSPAPGGEETVISFSGGVADCIESAPEPLAFGDLGPVLGRAIRESLLCRGQYRLGTQTIRATVIGAGCHSAQLSGSTVFCRNVTFPLKNLPVVRLSDADLALPAEELSRRIRHRLAGQDTAPVLSMAGFPAPPYAQVVTLAEAIAGGLGNNPALIAVERDMAKALGQAVALRLPPDRPCLCIDRVRLEEGSYLDVTSPVGPALPVVVKTLILAG